MISCSSSTKKILLVIIYTKINNIKKIVHQGK
jgi:hypothetical protein